MELRRYLTILRKRWWLIAATLVAAVAVTAAVVDTDADYSAHATIYVGANNFLPDQAQPSEALSGDVVTGLTQLIRTFAVMVDSVPIAEDAVARTGVERSARSVVSATQSAAIEGTNLLVVQVTDPDPLVAQQLANGVAEAFVEQIAEIEPGQTFGEGDVPLAPARIFERAQLPTVPQTESVTSAVVIAALIALGASVGLILLAEYLDVTLRTPEEAESRLALPVLGVIPLLSLDTERLSRREPPPGEDSMELVRDG